MGPVASSELGEYVRYMTLHTGFADRELVGNLLVGLASRDELQHISFARRQVVSRGINQFRGQVRRYALLPDVHGADGLQEFPVHLSLQNIGSRTCFKGSQYLDIP